MPLIPPRDPRDLKTRNSGIEMPSWIWAELEKVAKASGYTRNEVVTHFAKAWLAKYDRDQRLGEEASEPETAGGGLLPKRDLRDKERKNSGLLLPIWMWDQFEKIGDAHHYSRSAIIVLAMKWAIAEYAREQKLQEAEPKKK